MSDKRVPFAIQDKIESTRLQLAKLEARSLAIEQRLIKDLVPVLDKYVADNNSFALWELYYSLPESMEQLKYKQIGVRLEQVEKTIDVSSKDVVLWSSKPKRPGR